MQKQGFQRPAPLRHRLSSGPSAIATSTRRPQVQGDEAVSPCLPNMARHLLRKGRSAAESARLTAP